MLLLLHAVRRFEVAEQRVAIELHHRVHFLETFHEHGNVFHYSTQTSKGTKQVIR